MSVPGAAGDCRRKGAHWIDRHDGFTTPFYDVHRASRRPVRGPLMIMSRIVLNTYGLARSFNPTMLRASALPELAPNFLASWNTW